MTMQGVACRIAYAAVQTEFRQTLRAIKRAARKQRSALRTQKGAI
jgi:hypothetical protein